ncbi:molybdate ABC transporter substrate-binding protein [Corallococcus sp. bb12-1]|uniref:molybdate ABC transporter substrate-binding protein n=1 Tax=Corallococcus sp. bb12-1 TaxID=2996784 RepID=UPI00226F9F96|nr:molybdate ABC transporter substrate-binding protein [Corallococcus sp. bb12-1]MCY1040065.1 molybdate ABC transporter substrate-binding protein [Corallococcus sp. bb12-1]
MRLSWLGLLVAVWAGAVRAEDEVLVFAAASTTDALQALAPAFQRETGLRVRFAFGASSDLSRQVVAGAPADAFLSADEAKLDALERAGLVQPGSRVDLLANRLVVIVPVASRVEVEDAAGLKGLRRVALAEPAAVPAGVYAKEWLTQAGVWKDVAPNVVPVVDVRAVLAAVEAGRADAGVVYVTDALQSKKVRVAFNVPGAESPRIVYPAAALTQGKSPKGGLAFVRFLRTDVARAEFRKRGFQEVRLVTPGRLEPRSAPDAGPGPQAAPDAGGARAAPGAGKGQRSP